MLTIKEQLKELLITQFASGMARKAVTRPSKWAEAYRVISNHKWSFDRHPWLKDMHNSPSRYNVGQKAAQMGFTETLLNLAFYTIDVLTKDVLYVLPNLKPDASDFSSGRFDPAREQSPHIANMFTNVDNIGHKRAGIANLYIRGSQSRAGLKSLPIHTLLLDEVAEFVEENIPLVMQRVAGQDDYNIWMVSTPTHEGFGISKYYVHSDQRLFNFRCPSCSRFITFRYPESLVICGDDKFDPKIKESHLICTECKVILPHEQKIEFLQNYEWVPQFSGRDWCGWNINQLYSTAEASSPEKIAVAVFNAQANPADEVELFNSILGVPHTIKGARIDDADIDNCIMSGPKHRRNDHHPLDIITMGIDVGKHLHYEISRWIITNTQSVDISLLYKPIVIDYGKVTEFSDLDKLMAKYNVSSCVIDMNPEKRTAKQFADRHYGRVKLCYFSRGIHSRSVITDKNIDDHAVSCDRSSWLDLALGRFKNGSISLPIDTNLEYRQHIMSPVKTYVKDSDGNPVAKYLTQDSQQDHYAFARLYDELALLFAGVYGTSENINRGF